MQNFKTIFHFSKKIVTFLPRSELKSMLPVKTQRNFGVINQIKMQFLNPRESGEYIVHNAAYLTVHKDGMVKLSQLIFGKIKSGKLRSENFSQNNPGLHPSSSDPKALEWIFVLDTLNFCFWTPGKTNNFI